MRFLQSLTFNEKFAVGLLALFCPVYLIAAVLLAPTSVLTGADFSALLLWHICWAVIAVVALCAAVATIFLKPAFHPARLRLHAGRTLPLAGLLAGIVLGSVAMDTISTRQQRTFADQNENALAGIAPRAVVYRQGVPDGGIAIVRSPKRNPEGFTQATMIELTGERIKSCQRISETDWSCHFD